MADERYEWLDEDAAERLLRGEPVEPVDDHARAQAERLSAALGSVSVRPHEQELPGEAAALAAFRQVRGAAHAAPRRRRLRPVRVGLVAAVVGCALGGVAVAAGTGVLQIPVPFSDRESPSPGASVSVAAPPGDAPSAESDGASPGIPSQDGGVTRETPGPSHSGSGTDDESGDGEEPGAESTDEGMDRAVRDACHDYRDGHVDSEGKRRLVDAADGMARIRRFCDQVLAEEQDRSDKNSDDDGDTGARDNDKGDGNAEDDENGNGDRSDGTGRTGSGTAGSAAAPDATTESAGTAQRPVAAR
ncbi:hypothetical protein GCM10020367_39490 [Streptomyces sannanensis]|uniref:Extensin n=1 Tax=Streptomyces sannanensis TaxID=285536 RepID=A0ABP6SF99_9ACTN